MKRMLREGTDDLSLAVCMPEISKMKISRFYRDLVGLHHPGRAKLEKNNVIKWCMMHFFRAMLVR
jgi:hypothetical protein